MSSEAFVWAWLPGSRDPIVCGVVRETAGGRHTFNYGRSYLENPDAIGLFGLPLAAGNIPADGRQQLHGVLRDALPDAWGQHVILRTLTGQSGRDADTDALTPLSYMLNSGSGRFGAIDFQASPEAYVPRDETATLDDLAGAARALEEGLPLPASLDAALFHGTSIGGARPKVTIVDSEGEHWIAKLSASSDNRPVVRQEALALELARRCDVHVVDSRLTQAAGRDALLVRRFDRGPDGTRVMTVSALTMLGLDELEGRYGTYPDLLDRLGEHSDGLAGEELFCRIAVNMAVGNSDDHARNHAALWDGRRLALSPAYDIDPCRTPSRDSNQAMAWGSRADAFGTTLERRHSNLFDLTKAAAIYGLTVAKARSQVEHVVDMVQTHWHEAADGARLSDVERSQLWGTAILNEGVTDGVVRRRIPQPRRG